MNKQIRKRNEKHCHDQTKIQKKKTRFEKKDWMFSSFNYRKLLPKMENITRMADHPMFIHGITDKLYRILSIIEQIVL